MMQNKSDAAYKTIGEVSELLALPAHVLRFWERKFAQIAPYKNNGRRYYTQDDISMIKNIQFLLYEKGLTIIGVSKHLASESSPLPLSFPALGEGSSPDNKINSNLDSSPRAGNDSDGGNDIPSQTTTALKSILTTLKHTKAQLQDALLE